MGRFLRCWCQVFHTHRNPRIFVRARNPKKKTSGMRGEAPKRKDSAAERMLDAFASKYAFFAVFLFF